MRVRLLKAPFISSTIKNRIFPFSKETIKWSGIDFPSFPVQNSQKLSLSVFPGRKQILQPIHYFTSIDFKDCIICSKAVNTI